MTHTDPAEPGAIAPGSTPASAALTGDPRVDQALGRLAGLADLPLPEHAAVFGHIHAELTGALGTLDSGNDRFPQAPIASDQTPRAAAAHGTPATPDS